MTTDGIGTNTATTQTPEPANTDLHVRLREARERFGSPAIMARTLSVRVWALSRLHGLHPTDRGSLLALRDDLDTLAYWCSSVGAG